METNIIRYLDIEYSRNIIKLIKEKLSNTTKIKHFNGWYNRTLYGYHSFDINNIKLIGQRNPNIRLKKIKEYINFENKTLIDFGCNNGGMIFHIPELRKAIGIDFDANCIKSCEEMSLLLGYDIEYKFKRQDLNKFDLIKYLYEEEMNKVDIIFLLSLGSWVKNWEKLYKDSLKKSEIIVLETNNDKEGLPQLELFRKLECEIIMISDKSDDDMTGNIGRKTYLIKNK